MKRFFSKIFVYLAVIIAIIAAVILTIPSGGSSFAMLGAVFSASGLSIAGVTLSGTMLMTIAVGGIVLAYMIHSPTAKSEIDKATEFVGDIAKGAGKAVGLGVNGLAKGLGIMNYALLIFGGVFIFNYINSES